jgi:hypothetical protein
LLDGTEVVTDEIEQDYYRASKFKVYSEDPKYSTSAQTEFGAIAKYILIEATLNCYKLLFLTIKEDLLSISNPLTIYLCTKNNHDYYHKFEEFIDLAEKADQVELTGRPIQAIDLMKDSVRIGYELLNSIDKGFARKIEKILEKINIGLVSKFIVVLILFRIASNSYPSIVKYTAPLMTYFSSLEGVGAIIASVIASFIFVVIAELYGIIKRGF